MDGETMTDGFVWGSREVTGPLSPYAGLHPVLTSRAKGRAARLGISPASAINDVRAERDALENRILTAPWDELLVTEFCEERFADVQRSGDDPDVTLVDVRAGVYAMLRLRGRDAQRIVGAITGIQEGVFRTLPNGEREEADQ